MKSYKRFISNAIEEDTIAFRYNDGGDDQTVVINGSKSQLKKVENILGSNTRYIDADDAPRDAMKISASNWLKIN